MLLDQPWLGMMSFSKSHFSPGDRIAITSYQKRGDGTGFNDSGNQGGDRIAWFDLETNASIPWAQGQPDPTNAAIKSAEGSAWGFVSLDGETRSAVTPSFSHDGAKIAYTSASGTQDGRIGDNAETDVHIVPFANRAGGSITALAGASTSGVSEYYPSFSADDALIAFNRAASTSGKIYYRPDAEVNVIPVEGGTPTRLAANDPAACSGEKSPGVINSWAKWSPSVVTTGGKAYYFLIFSSARDYPGTHEVTANQYSPSDTRASQLYMTAVVRDTATGALTTYGAVYLWNQDPTTSNLTPAWDSFNIPPVPPPR
jgi:Tol biopolymer transport system component